MNFSHLHRRTFLSQVGLAVGSTALSSLMMRNVKSASAGSATSPVGLDGLPHIAPKAKRVIFLCMAGGPSHLESFDYKPRLEQFHGQDMPKSITQNQPIAQLQGKKLVVHRPMASFSRYGESGIEISDFFPHCSELADDICVIRSMVTEQINHDPAHTFMNTGTAISGRPSMGAWVTYGLGSECDNLPGFVVLTSTGGSDPQPIASRQWSAGCLPGRFQGVPFNSQGDPVHYLSSPPGVSRQGQKSVIDSIMRLDSHHNKKVTNPEVEARIAAYEMAFRMQTSVPELTNFADEPAHVLAKYGATPGDGSYASNCLLARRLVERGVRFIQLYHTGWDHHGALQKYMTISCEHTDQATCALVNDLKQRGLLDETLVIWGGEFGRTPMIQGSAAEAGRDHHIKGFTMWMAGGGTKPGYVYGKTDEFGYHAVENPVHVRDLHATMLHLLGINHERFSVPFQGLNVRLTGVERAHVVRDLLT